MLTMRKMKYAYSEEVHYPPSFLFKDVGSLAITWHK